MRNQKMFVKHFAVIMAVFMLMSSIVVSADTKYLPDVTASMSKASYWVKKDSAADEVLTTPEEIKQINKDIISEEKTGVWDMTTWTKDTYDGVARNAELLSAAEGDARYCYDPDEGYGARYKYNEVTKQYDEYKTWEEAYVNLYKEMIDNCVDKEATESMATGYAICTKRTELRILPSPTPLPDSPSDQDFDVQYLTAVSVGEPLIIRGKSTDGKYYHAKTSYLTGWVAASDIAFCKDRAEWLSAWNFDGDEALIVYDDKITTEDSNSAPETANRKLTMGVKLRIADRKDWEGRINNRYAYNNYVVWMPVRHEDGSFENKLTLISEHCKVNEGYLPVTTRNLAEVLFNQLGDAYGWGGMLHAQDCSGYIRDVYRCFGLELGRNTTNQAAQPVLKYNLDGKTAEEKTAIIKNLPLGAELLFNGHAMIYLGNEGDKLYVISSVSNLMVDGIKTRVRGAVVNTLDIKRANGKTWLESLHTAEVPYYNAKTTDLAGATISSINDTTYTGNAIKPTPTITLGGKTLKENVHYTLTYTNNTNVGQGTVTIKGKGNVTGTRTANFKINPKGTNITKLSKGKASIKVTWKKQATKMSTARITGYQIQYATNGSYTKNKKTVKIKKYSTTKKQIKKLKRKKKYYVRIRTYKTIGSTTYYSKWSTTKTVKTK